MPTGVPLLQKQLQMRRLLCYPHHGASGLRRAAMSRRAEMTCLSSRPRRVALCVATATGARPIRTRAAPAGPSSVDIARARSDGGTANRHRALSAALEATSLCIQNATNLGSVMVAVAYRRHARWNAFGATGAITIFATIASVTRLKISLLVHRRIGQGPEVSPAVLVRAFRPAASTTYSHALTKTTPCHQSLRPSRAGCPRRTRHDCPLRTRRPPTFDLRRRLPLQEQVTCPHRAGPTRSQSPRHQCDSTRLLAT